MRTIETAAGTALAGGAVPLILLVEMLLSEPVRMASAPIDIVYDGDTYLGLGDLGTIEPIDDSPGENKSLRFILSGVATSLLALALAEDIRGKPCHVRMAVLDPVTHEVLDAPLVWSGTLDQMPVSVGSDTSTISVTAEHRGTTYARAKPLRYTDVDQQRLYPGDTSLRFVASQANHQDIWPATSYWRI